MNQVTAGEMVSTIHHREVEKELRELKGHVQSLLETANGFYFYRLAVEPGVPPKTRIVMVSPSIIDVMGIKDANDFESWFTGLHPDDAPRIMAAHQKTIETGALFDQEARWFHAASGKWVWLRAMSQPLYDAEGVITHFNGICIDITGQRHSEEVLKQSVAQLRNLAMELTQAEERERKRLAAKLHDDVQQSLVAATMKISLIDRQASAEEHDRVVREALNLVGEAINSSRSLATDLYPPVMMDGELLPGLRWLADRMKERHGLTVELSREEIPGMTATLSILLFQGVRELLFNVVKHAGVKTVSVTVNQPDAKTIQVVVNDHGVGFSGNNAEGLSTCKGLGMFLLRERLAYIGGSLDVVSAPGQGTTVSITVSTY